MAFDLGNAHKLLTDAIQNLAAGTGSIQERLRNAYAHALVHLKIHEFPLKAQPRLKAVEAAMTDATAKGDEGVHAAAAQGLDDDQARKLVQHILEIFHWVARQDALRDCGTELEDIE